VRVCKPRIVGGKHLALLAVGQKPPPSGHNCPMSRAQTPEIKPEQAAAVPLDFELPTFPDQASPASPPALFDADTTTHFQASYSKAPAWLCSLMASNKREKRRLADELMHIKGAWPLLMKQRRGGKWTADDKVELKTMLRSASRVSPYVFIWAIPGSMLLLPFLAWYLDRKRKKQLREAK
jgi:hypothetical protein